MTFATFTNIIVILIGGAVLVQSVRMMRSFQAVKDGGLKDMVTALERATVQARAVLADLKETLRTDGAANARVLAQSETIRDELSVMIGIANAAAERMLEGVEASKPAPKRARTGRRADAKASAEAR